MALTSKQEAFAQAVASGKSQSDAYREAYPSSTSWKPDSVHNKASALMRDAQVAARIKELKAELADKELWTREDSVRTMKAVIADPEARCADKTAAVKVLNEMHGYNAPTELKHSGGMNINLNVNFVE